MDNVYEIKPSQPPEHNPSLLASAWAGLTDSALDPFHTSRSPANHDLAYDAGQAIGNATIFTAATAAIRILPGVGKFAPALVGGVFGYMSPTNPDATLTTRLENAASGAATVSFLTHAPEVLGKYTPITNRFAQTLTAGASAGFLSSEANALINEHHLASVNEIGTNMLMFAGTGAAFHGIGLAAGKVLGETSATRPVSAEKSTLRTETLTLANYKKDFEVTRKENGTVTVRYADGRLATENGDLRSATLADGTKWSSMLGTNKIVRPDGTKLEESPDSGWYRLPGKGFEETHFADGSVTKAYSDHSVARTLKSGQMRVYGPDWMSIDNGQLLPRGETSPRLDALRADMQKAGVSLEQIRASAAQENFLGKGTNGTVYKIPGLDDYVFKKSHEVAYAEAAPNAVPRPEPYLVGMEENFPGHNIGQPIAQIGDGEQILLKQNGIPSGALGLEEREAAGPEKTAQDYLNKLHTVASMPQSSYDNFARMLMDMREHGLAFDSAMASNVLIDAPNQSFNPIDIGRFSKYHPTTDDMIKTLVQPSSIDIAPNVQPLYATIAGKVYQSARNTGLDLGPTDFSFFTGMREFEAQMRAEARARYASYRPQIFIDIEKEFQQLLAPAKTAAQ